MPHPASRTRAPGLRPMVLPAVVALGVFAALVGLGMWQLERLTWKEGILARIEARIHAEPVPPPAEAAWPGLRPEDLDYTRVRISGTFIHTQEALVARASGNGKPGFDGPGYLVLTPLIQADGSIIIVNRGFVPLVRRDPSSRAAGQVEGMVSVTGLLRPAEPRNAFTPADDPASGRWYTRDPVLIAQSFGLKRAAPFTLDAEAEPASPGGLPIGGATVLAIPNNHLSYALTWFGLALALVGVFGVFAWRQRQAPSGT